MPSDAVHPLDDHLRLPDTLGETERRAAVDEYLARGRLLATVVASSLNAAGFRAAAGSQLLDFASGYGRTGRFLPDVLPDVTVTACDIHQEAVEFVREALGFEALLSTHDPEALDLGRTFDAIAAVSFFTELNPEKMGAWLAALYRHLAPGGLLYFTAHGRGALRAMGVTAVPGEGAAFMPASPPRYRSTEFGMAYTTIGYVLDRIWRFTRAPVAHFVEGLVDGTQDAYVIARSEGAAPQGAG
jgi:SAM-dependent methyltransferase